MPEHSLLEIAPLTGQVYVPHNYIILKTHIDGSLLPPPIYRGHPATRSFNVLGLRLVPDLFLVCSTE